MTAARRLFKDAGAHYFLISIRGYNVQWWSSPSRILSLLSSSFRILSFCIFPSAFFLPYLPTSAPKGFCGKGMELKFFGETGGSNLMAMGFVGIHFAK